MYSSFGALMPQTLLQAVGQGKLASGYGFEMICIAVGSLLGASIAGKVQVLLYIYTFVLYYCRGNCVFLGI